MSIWTLRCHCVSIAEYSKAREGEVKSVVDRWMAELIRDEEKNVVTLCPTCSRAVNGDVGGCIRAAPPQEARRNRGYVPAVLRRRAQKRAVRPAARPET